MKKNEMELKKLLGELEIDTSPRAEHRNRLREEILKVSETIVPPAPLLRHARYLRWVERVSVLAAGVILGLGIGLMVDRQTAEPQPVTVVKTVIQPSQPASDTESNDEASNGLWSVARFKKRFLAPRSKQMLRVNWTSPIRKPQLGEMQ